MAKRKALVEIAGSNSELPLGDTLEQEDRLPRDDLSATPLGSGGLQRYDEVLMGFSKQGTSLLFIDKPLGVMTRLVTTTVPSGAGNGMALGPDNQLYVIPTVGGVDTVYRVDPVTGIATSVVTINRIFPIDVAGLLGLDFHPVTGVLYAIAFGDPASSEHLAVIDIDPSSGNFGDVTSVGLMTADAGTGDALAIDPVTGNAFALWSHTPNGASGFKESDLYSVNLVTGAATLIGDTLFDRGSSLAFDAAGVLYGVQVERIASGEQHLVTYNTGTGAATKVNNALQYEQIITGNSNWSVTDITFSRLGTAAGEISTRNLNQANYAQDYGVADAYLIPLHPARTLVAGDGFDMRALNANAGGACTVDINNTGTTSVKLRGGADPAASDILAGGIYTFIFDGTNLQLINPS